MSPTDPHDHRVLVPVDVLGGESVPSTVIDAFASVSVVLLVYREIPDQTALEQARDRFGERARAELEELRSVFEDAGADVTARVVFTHDRLKTFERVAVERECDAVLLLNPAPVLERVLVAIRGDVNVDHIAGLVGSVLADTEINVTLLHVVQDDRRREAGEELLEAAAAGLESQGIDPERVGRTIVVDGSPTDAILDAAADHDLLVAGESRPSIRRFVFRDRAERLARETVDPVLVVRGEYLDPGDGQSGSDRDERVNSGDEEVTSDRDGS